MDLSIVIVNWNSKEYLRKCIASILSTTKDIRYEIVVIDSGSFDGCGQMLREEYPQVRFLQSERNLGFGQANNRAFRESQGRHILFLNPDTEVLGAAVTTLDDLLRRLPDAGAVGCRLLNTDRSVQTSCIQSFPTIFNQFLDSELLRRWWPKSPLWGNGPLFVSSRTPEEVEAISGACLMVKRSVFEKVGMFSEDYFMYAEDLDLCYKIRQTGAKNYYIPNASVIHFGGGSTEKGPSDFSIVMMRESVWRFMNKTRGEFYGWAYRASIMISAIGRLMLLLMVWPFHLLRQKEEAWRLSLNKWKALLAWSLRLQ